MDKKNFETTVSSLYKGLDQVMSTKTVVGEPQMIGNTIIVPLMDVSFGMGAGAFGKEKSDSSAGGIGGKMSPCAILVIQDGIPRIVNVKNQDTILKLIDMVPDTVNRITNMIKGSKDGDDPEVEAAIQEEMQAETIREEL